MSEIASNTVVGLQESTPVHSKALARNAGEMNDEMALAHWLDVYRSRSLQTWRSYSKEAQRFRYFLLHQKDASHSSHPNLMRDASELDIAMFEAALMGKEFKGIRPGLQAIDEHGRPAGPYFKAPLRRSSANQALIVLHAMYEHWRKPNGFTQKPYVTINPVSRIIKSTSRAREQSERSVPQEAIAAMAEMVSAQELEAKTTKGNESIEAARATRTRWLLYLLFGLWLRRAEAASLRMNSFYKSHTGWLVKIERKGGKEQTTPVPDWVMDMLFSYRTSLGMPAIPSKDDSRPAILPIQPKGRRSPGQTISAQTIYMDVKRLASDTAEAIANGHFLQDLESERRALIEHQLQSFSPHWFRHTGATIAINSGSITLENASKMLGHTSTAVTSAMYYHEDREKLREGLNQMGSALLRK